MRRTAASDLPQHVIDKMSAPDRKEMGLLSSEEVKAASASAQAKREERSEAEIQRQVEAYLVQLGYERRTPENIARGMPRRGWFVHLHEAKRNPILLDLLILSHSGAYLELELKTASGRTSTEQQALIAQGGLLARSAEEACRKIREWDEFQNGVKPWRMNEN